LRLHRHLVRIAQPQLYVTGGGTHVHVGGALDDDVPRRHLPSHGGPDRHRHLVVHRAETAAAVEQQRGTGHLESPFRITTAITETLFDHRVGHVGRPDDHIAGAVVDLHLSDGGVHRVGVLGLL